MNLLHLEPPLSSYSCSVRRYYSGHSTMFIELVDTTQKKATYLLFDQVKFFSGPFYWRGADFQLGQHEECVKILRQIGLTNELMYPIFNFFLIPTDEVEIKIIAAARYVHTDVMPENW